MRAISTISGQIIDVLNRRIFPGTIHIEGGRIKRIEETPVTENTFILPGFIDAHIHIESSMLTPYEFARVALKHGTVATVSDPHEIANVLGVEGVHYMLENAREAKLKFNFGAPSCVPATDFETSGAVLDAKAVAQLLERDDILYLSEMMNYPGVLFKDPEVLKKIAAAKANGKPVDGHAPGLRGEDAANYIAAGISTDHECFTLEEALDKVQHGMKILIREGSAARNFEALHPLLKSHPQLCMFCCDDKHPDELLLSHINSHVKRAIGLGYDLFDVLTAACVNPVQHYNLNVGLLQEDDPADFISIDNLNDFNVSMTVINGEVVAEKGICLLPAKKHPIANNFGASAKSLEEFQLKTNGTDIRIIEALDGQLITRELHDVAKVENGFAVADASRDILKIVVVNRYTNCPPAIAFIKNFGLQNGAIASSVAHDSHNIIAVGADDASIMKAVNLLIKHTGGLSLVDGDHEMVIGLPIAGLMSDQDCETIGNAYGKIDKHAKKLGSKLRAPYMTLSFMALLVIPQLKLSDKGLFDGKTFQFSPVFLQ
jgi:adenine deaminase